MADTFQRAFSRVQTVHGASGGAWKKDEGPNPDTGSMEYGYRPGPLPAQGDWHEPFNRDAEWRRLFKRQSLDAYMVATSDNPTRTRAVLAWAKDVIPSKLMTDSQRTRALGVELTRLKKGS